MIKFNHDFSSRFRLLKGGKISLVVSALLGSTVISFAAPSGGTVTTGTATISQSGNVTNINQSTQKASINWQNFSIASNETVNFKQPNVNSITLNRVVGNERSVIDGALNANGQVWILNSNGILFNSTAKINTAGIIATTKNISDADFQAGNYKFSGDSTASVINMGTIEVSDNGYVALLANTVQNNGTIKAYKGTVHLTGASEATINLNGNSIVSLTVNKGVLDALVENKNIIQADGGKIYLTTNAVDEILKGVVNNTGVLEANSIDDIAGKVELFAHGGTANVSGTIEAKGGFVETSGKNLSVADGTVIKAKKWLLDPENVVIESTGTGAVDGADAQLSISAAAIETALATADVEIQATNDITVNQAINIARENTNTEGGYQFDGIGLTLTAGNDININNVITVGPNAYLTLNHGWDGVTEWDGSNEETIYGNGGKITFGMLADKTDFAGKVLFDIHPAEPLATTNSIYINEVEQTLIRNASELQALSLTGNYVLAADIDMTAQTFTPIGYNLYDDEDNYAKEFKGKFNGLGNSISNLMISTDYNWDDDSDFKATGLFGNVSGGAVISNIRLSHASVINTATSNIYPMIVGGLVGYARGQYDPNNHYAFVAAPTIHNNIVTGSTITSNGWNVGGIVGGAEDNVVLSNNAVTSTTVTSSGKGYVGGIAGYVSGNVKIDNAYVSGSTITAGGAEAAGAITGSLQRQSELTNSYAQTNIITAKRDAGGLVGIIEDFGDNDYKPVTISNSFYKLDDTSINEVTGVITYGGIYSSQATAWLAGNKADLNAATYLGTQNGGFYTIDSVQDLNDMLGLVYNPANKFKLSTNLSLTAGWYLPVLTGTFDGNGKTLTGLNVNQDYNANIGFVGRLLGGTVQNLTISGATLNGYANVGGIAGMMRGNTFVFDAGSTRWGSFTDGATITGSHVTGLNYNIDKTFDATWNAMDNGVNYDSIGGLVGTAQSKSVISNSDSAGSITMDIKSDGFSDYVGASSIGGLVGSAWGDDIAFDHVSSNVGITLTSTALVANSDIGFESIGGLVGSMGGGDNINAVLSNASASGAMSVTTKNFTDGGNDYNIENIGGLLGYVDGLDATTLSATNTISVKGDNINNVGGIVGGSNGATYDGVTRTQAITINPADATTNQDSGVDSIGGLIGYSDNDTIANATVSGTITLGTTATPINYAESVGGAVGNAYGTNIDTTVSSVSISASNVIEGENFGGLVGYNTGDTDDLRKNTYRTTFRIGDLTAQYTEAKTTYLARADVIALLTQGYELYDGSYNGSSNQNPYYDIYFEMKKYNVELGNISNSRASGNVIAPSVSNVGGLVGYNYLDGDIGAVITSSHASGEVKGLDNVGGLVGHNDGGNISTSYAEGKVTATDENVGGLVGYNSGYNNQLSDNQNNTSSAIYDTPELAQDALAANITAYEAAHLGYIQNYNNNRILEDGISHKFFYSIDMEYNKDVSVGTITNSYATGEVVGHGATYVGGLVGHNYNNDSTGATISNSYATGVIKANDSENVGGLVGANERANIVNSYATSTVTANNSNNVGGLVGEANNSHIETSYASGKVTGHDNVGGLVGFMQDSPTTILNSYAVGNVVGNDSVGGLVGRITDSTVTNTYSSGAVTGATNVGGLVGQVDDQYDATTVNASFYNSTKNPTVADNTYGTAKTTAQMNTLATYTTDLGDAAWDIVEDSSLTKMFSQFASSGSIWKMNPMATIDPGTAYSVTPTPEPTPVVIKPVIETNKDIEKVITSITNQQQVNVKLPTIVTDVKITNNIVTPSINSNSITNNSLSTNNSFATNMFKKLDVSTGESLSLVSTPVEGVVSEKITMNDLQSLKNSPASDSNNVNGSSEVRVSLGNGSIVELVNGGVTLPTGVEQEFYVQKTDSKNNNGAN